MTNRPSPVPTPSSSCATPLSRRGFCRSGLFGAAGLVACLAAQAQTDTLPVREPSDDPTNILLIVSDDLGCQLGCYGDPLARTPTLDRIASEGVRFENAYVTQASCSPSRSSIFTGLYPHQNGQIGLSHMGYSRTPGLPLLPMILKQQGYYTGVIGKVHSEPENEFVFDYDQRGAIFATRDMEQMEQWGNQFFSDRADRPFFLMINFFDPHRPYENVDQIKGHPAQPFCADDVAVFPFIGFDDPTVRQDVTHYYNCASRVDDGVAMLMDLLHQYQLDSNTLVVFVGDHGPPFTRAKTTCYEAGVRVPLLFWYPNGDVRSNFVPEALVSTVDLFPTILAAAGVTSDFDHAGQSLWPLLHGQSVPWREHLFTEFNTHEPWHYYPRRSVRNARYKLVHNLLSDRPNPVRGIDGCAAWEAALQPEKEGTFVHEVFERYDQPPEYELFDLHTDPHEFHNLAGVPQYATVEQELKTVLMQWREETADPLLNPEVFANWLQQHEQNATRHAAELAGQAQDATAEEN